MASEVILLKFNGQNLRIRKEGDGCLIFNSNGSLARGNATTWQILNMLSEGVDSSKISAILSAKYSLPEHIVVKDIDLLKHKIASVFYD